MSSPEGDIVGGLLFGTFGAYAFIYKGYPFGLFMGIISFGIVALALIKIMRRTNNVRSRQTINELGLPVSVLMDCRCGTCERFRDKDGLMKCQIILRSFEHVFERTVNSFKYDITSDPQTPEYGTFGTGYFSWIDFLLILKDHQKFTAQNGCQMWIKRLCTPETTFGLDPYGEQFKKNKGDNHDIR